MPHPYNWKRNARIYKKVLAKKQTLREIALKEGMSHTNVVEIFRRHEQKLKGREHNPTKI